MSRSPRTGDPRSRCVIEWAERVRSSEPHDLQELEDRLRAQAKPSRGIRALTVVGILAMVAGITVTRNASEGVTGATGAVHVFDFGSGFELAVLFVSFVAVCAFQGKVLLDWRANGRVRDASTRDASAFVAAASALAVVLTVTRVGFEDALRAGVHLAPPGLALLAGAAGIVVSLSGRRPSGWRSGWNGAPTVNLAALSPEEQKVLLVQRNQALRILASRGLLDSDPSSLQALEARPLGRLIGS